MIPRPSRRACEITLWLILAFSVFAFTAIEWWSRAILECLIFLLAAMCSLRPDFAPQAKWPLIGFGAIILLTGLQALNIRPAAGPADLLPFATNRSMALHSLLLWTAWGALLWSASGILLWEGAQKRLALTVFVIGLLIAFIGILQRGQGNTSYYGLRPVGGGRNPFGPFVNHNHAANWLVASFVVGAGLLAGRLKPRRDVPVSEWAAKSALMVFILGLSLAAILNTGSRGAFNALVLSSLATAILLSVGLMQSRIRRFALLGILALCSIYALFLASNPRWMAVAGGKLDDSASFRVSLYRSSLNLLADFPVFGLGPDAFRATMETYKEPAILYTVDQTHSSWLEAALEGGILGLVLLAASLLAPVAGLGRRLMKEQSPGRLLCAGWFTASIALIIHGFVESNFLVPANAALLLIVIAAASASFVLASEDISHEIGTWRVSLAAAFLALALMSLPPGFSKAGPKMGRPNAAAS